MGIKRTEKRLDKSIVKGSCLQPLMLLLSSPVFQHVLRSVTNKDMDVIDTTDTLQCNPVLEPEDMVLAFPGAKSSVQLG